MIEYVSMGGDRGHEIAREESAKNAIKKCHEKYVECKKNLEKK